MSREQNGEVNFGQSIVSLAEYFGWKRPSLSRAIAEMVRDGIITFQNGKGKVLDFDAMENLLL